MMLESCKGAAFIIRLLEDLKVFYCLTRDFLTSDLNACGLDLDSLDVLQDYSETPQIMYSDKTSGFSELF